MGTRSCGSLLPACPAAAASAAAPASVWVTERWSCWYHSQLHASDRLRAPAAGQHRRCQRRGRGARRSGNNSRPRQLAICHTPCFTELASLRQYGRDACAWNLMRLPPMLGCAVPRAPAPRHGRCWFCYSKGCVGTSSERWSSGCEEVMRYRNTWQGSSSISPSETKENGMQPGVGEIGVGQPNIQSQNRRRAACGTPG